MSVNKSHSRSSDDLAVLISLAVVLGILLSTSATMWLWSVIPRGVETAIVENIPESP